MLSLPDKFVRDGQTDGCSHRQMDRPTVIKQYAPPFRCGGKKYHNAGDVLTNFHTMTPFDVSGKEAFFSIVEERRKSW